MRGPTPLGGDGGGRWPGTRGVPGRVVPGEHQESIEKLQTGLSIGSAPHHFDFLGLLRID